AEHPALAAALEDHTVLLGPMGHDELRRAIEEPAASAGLRLETGLADVMLADVVDRPGNLPLLSHALLETWRRRRGPILTLDAYREAGGAQGAIARTADDVFEHLDGHQQAVARNLLLRLTSVGDETEPTRRRAAQADLLTTSADPKA
ncbi:MAG: hypothetical protein ACR2MB_15115, partial [Acidimicrobiales bacterium]